MLKTRAVFHYFLLMYLLWIDFTEERWNKCYQHMDSAKKLTAVMVLYKSTKTMLCLPDGIPNFFDIVTWSFTISWFSVKSKICIREYLPFSREAVDIFDSLMSCVKYLCFISVYMKFTKPLCVGRIWHKVNF